MMRALLALFLLSGAALADEALEQGRADFAKLCAPCHGPWGKGDGPQASHLAKKPSDLTLVTARYGRFPEDRVFETIAGIDMPEGHGTREMPSWGDVFVSEGVGKSTKIEDAMKASDDASRRIAGLMRYIESIQAAP
ncbi:c-type cytochrome [Aestuariivirga sp.]|uniref:c-type cytochrome n=1 Tax=Aestuariivirga sp. TaxID=2650926 RepID=UPI00391B7FD6